MQSKAKTVQEYLASLPPERRQPMQAVRALIGKIIASVPLATFVARYKKIKKQ